MQDTTNTVQVGKTGYTDEAGRTLITFAEKGNKTVIVAVFGASSSGRVDARYTDAINLFEYSFNNFSKKTIATANDYTFDYINVDKKLIYSICLKENLDILLAHNVTPDISYNISINDKNLVNLNADNFKPVIAGTITFNLLTQDDTVQQLTSKLYLTDIQTLPTVIPNHVVTILCAVLLTGLVIIIILISAKTKTTTINKTSRKSRRT